MVEHTIKEKKIQRFVNTNSNNTAPSIGTIAGWVPDNSARGQLGPRQVGPLARPSRPVSEV